MSDIEDLMIVCLTRVIYNEDLLLLLLKAQVLPLMSF
jgi:hypothetical protein